MAREATPNEGSQIVEGFIPMENTIKKLLERYPDSEAIKRAWCYIRQERFVINRNAEGLVISWGTGKHGELGLGNDIKYSPYPQINFWLRKVSIRHIAAGERHVLAIDTSGFLYSWGYGRCGRLGHGDFEDRNRPEQVKFFSNMIVVDCAAGDAHSAVLATAREYAGDPLRKVLCFGRGAHGRLGNGTNRNMHTPVQVRTWPPSVAGTQLQQIACGGAHTAVLAFKQVPRGLAFPFGVQTFVLTWGFGSNGQLGTGNLSDYFVPVRAKLPKAEVMVGIAAGRSWTIVQSLGGSLYSCGKGLRGQLGQDKTVRFSLAPREVPSYGSFLAVSSNFSHSLGITTPKKLLSLPRIEFLQRSSPETFDPFQVSRSLLTLKHRPSAAQFQVQCVKRISTSQRFVLRNISLALTQAPHNAIPFVDHADRKKKGKVTLKPTPLRLAEKDSRYYREVPRHVEEFESFRYDCLSCGMADVCHFCLQLCHKSHFVEQIRRTQSSFFYQRRLKASHEVVHPTNDKAKTIDAFLTRLLDTRRVLADPALLEQRRKKRKVFNKFKKRKDEPPDLFFPVPSLSSSLSTSTPPAHAAAPPGSGPLSGLTEEQLEERDGLLSSFQASLQQQESLLKALPFDKTLRLFHAANIFPRQLRARPGALEFFPLNFVWRLPRLADMTRDAPAASDKKAPPPPPPRTPKTPKSPKSPLSALKKSPSRRGVIARTPSNRALKSPKNKPANKSRGEKFLEDFLLFPPSPSGTSGTGGDNKRPQDGPVLTCQCSLYNGACRLAPNIEEVPEEFLDLEAAENEAKTRFLVGKTEKISVQPASGPGGRRKATPFVPAVVAETRPVRQVKFFTDDLLKASQQRRDRDYLGRFATRIQALGRGYCQRLRFALLKQDHILVRREVVTQHVQRAIFEPIFAKFAREYSAYSEAREGRLMAFEDQLMRQFDFYTKLQLSLLSINAVDFATREMIGKVSIQLPIIETLPPPALRGPVSGSSANQPPSSAQSLASAPPASLAGSRDSAEATKEKERGRRGRRVSFDEQRSLETSASQSSVPASLAGLNSKQQRARQSGQQERVKKLFAASDSADEADGDSLLTSGPASSSGRGEAEGRPGEEEERVHWFPSFTFTLAGLRHQQLGLHPSQRFPEEVAGRLARFYPLTASAAFKEGEYFDKDVLALVRRHIYSPAQEERLLAHVAEQLAVRRERQKAAEAALSRMKKRQLATNLATNQLTVRQRNELARNQQAAMDQFGRPQQQATEQEERRPGPAYPNEWRDEMDLQRYVHPPKALADVLAEARFTIFPPPRQVGAFEKRPQLFARPIAAFSLVQSENDEKFVAEQVAAFRKAHLRRYTLLGPERLYRRLCEMPGTLYEKNGQGRRYSLPESLTALYAKQTATLQARRPFAQQREEIAASIGLFELRRQRFEAAQELLPELRRRREESASLKEVLATRGAKKEKKAGSSYKRKKGPTPNPTNPSNPADNPNANPSQSEAAVGATPAVSRPTLKEQLASHPLRLEFVACHQRVRREFLGLFQLAPLTPALPREMTELLRDHSRRRSIGEPERLLPQLNSLMDLRELFALAVTSAEEELGVKRRRRSFDLQEERDQAAGVLDQLALSFAADGEVLLTHTLLKDSQRIDRRIAAAGLTYDAEKYREKTAEEKAVVEGEAEAVEGEDGEAEEKDGQPGSPGGSNRRAKSSKKEPRPAPKNLSRAKKQDGPARSALASLEEDEDDERPRTSHLFPVRGQQSRQPSQRQARPQLWQEHYTDDGLTYFFNPETEESVWEQPEGADVQILVTYQDEDTGQSYWLNHSTGEAYWLDGRLKE